MSGSPNLTPEQIVSYEAGYQGWFLNHRLQIRGDVFFNHLSNFISSATPTPQGVAFANAVGTADLYGGEVGAEFLVTPWLTGFANYSTVQVHQTSDLIAAQSFNGTRGAPSYKINAGLRGEWDSGFNAETLVHFVSAASYPVSLTHQFAAPFFGYVPPSNNVGSYTLLNTRVAYRFWHDKAEVAVSAFNALNDQHKENPVGNAIGSRVMGWLTLRY